MNKYELALIYSTRLEEEAKTELAERISGLITRFGGEIEKVDDWGKRRLAYPIDKQGEGFYSFVTFNSPAEAPAEIEKRVRILENVLRYLIIRVNA